MRWRRYESRKKKARYDQAATNIWNQRPHRSCRGGISCRLERPPGEESAMRWRAGTKEGKDQEKKRHEMAPLRKQEKESAIRSRRDK